MGQRIRIFLALLGGLFFQTTSLLFAQCNTQLTHGSGTLAVGGSNVTVTPSGMTSIYNSYCPAVTSPYFIGYSFGMSASGPGQFLFNFSPPVSGVRLNFSGASNTSPHIEEIRLSVNGSHYPIPSAGVANGCDAMAILTGAGDLRGCSGCSVSGWSNTVISGSISSLLVQDVVIGGTPNGSLFSLFICSVALPVDWLEVNGNRKAAHEVQVDWSTTTEINNAGFHVERSPNGSDWEAIGEMEGAGNATEVTHYSFTDEQAPNSRVFYRIRQTNMDGHESFSEVVEVAELENNIAQLWPNPAQSELYMRFAADIQPEITIWNPLGQQVACDVEAYEDGIRVDVHDLRPGFYWIAWVQDGISHTRKFQIAQR